MTRRTENRIWRGLFLAAIVGAGIAAAAKTSRPKPVVLVTNKTGQLLMVTEDGSLWMHQSRTDGGLWSRRTDGKKPETWSISP